MSLSDKGFISKERGGFDDVLLYKDVKEFLNRIIDRIDNAQEDCGNLEWIDKEHAIKIIKEEAGKELCEVEKVYTVWCGGENCGTCKECFEELK